LNLEVLYADKTSERHLTVYQEDLRKVGITLNLRLLTFETLVKLLDELQYDLAFIGYGGITFPNPETQLLSRLADQKNNNNITGFKNARVDELIKEYDLAYEIDDRVRILQEVDGLFTNAHHWVMEWYAPYQRVVFWNKFGSPRGHLSRTGDYRDMIPMWWIEPDKVQKLEQALRDPSINLGQGEVEDKYWLDFAKIEEKKQSEMAPRKSQ
jgi:microcin C transport system substrate-binding protein